LHSLWSGGWRRLYLLKPNGVTGRTSSNPGTLDKHQNKGTTEERQMTATNETMIEMIEKIKEIIYMTAAYTPLPEELASIHAMIKTNDPKLEETLNAFFGYDEDSDSELDDMFAELDDTEDSDDDMFLFNMIDEMFVALDNP
jgi:hypothetical protein